MLETIAGWVLFLCAAAWIVSDRAIAAVCWLDVRDQQRLAQEAADHGEPPREAVERLIDGDEWARLHGLGYVDELTEDWWPFVAPEFVGSDRADFKEWEREVQAG